MTCHCCKGQTQKFGSFQNKNRIVQRYRCARCAKTYSESQPLAGVRVEMDKSVQVVSMLCEGIGIRAISRLTSLNKETVLNILQSAGESCAALLNTRIRGLTVNRVQVDEVYGFVFCKQVNTTADDDERGDQYTWLSMERDTKLIINWSVSKRNGDNAETFIRDLKSRIVNRFQLSSDGFPGYIGQDGAVFQTFKHEVDYGTEVKHFATDRSGKGFIPRRENPVKIQWCKRTARIGNPDGRFINTSHVERLNLSMRLFNRRLTRLTLGYSKKLDNLRHSVALLSAFYNFCRVHNSLDGKTPAMAQGLTNRIWSFKELLTDSTI